MKRLALGISAAALALAGGFAIAAAIATDDRPQGQPATTHSTTYYITAVQR